MLIIYLFAMLLLVLAILILARRLGTHWRGALLAGILALWFWGMAFSVASFISFCRILGRHGADDPVRASEAMADCLTLCASVNSLACPLVILSVITWFTGQQTDSDSTLHQIPA